MRILIMGGTAFLGRAFAAEALAAGHSVTTFNRGETAPDVPGVEVVRGDRESAADLARLAEAGPWDAVVDTSGYVPAVVMMSARALAGRAAAYLFVSSISAVAGFPAEPVDDTSPAFDCPADAGADAGGYGELKAGCERAVEQEFPGSTLILRPGIFLGPHENVGRLPSWLKRLDDAGRGRDRRVLAPGDPDRRMSLMDARDIAVFGLRCLAEGRTGSYLVAGTERITYGQWLALCAEATGSSGELVWASDDFLVEQGVQVWSELPLWSPAGADEAAHVWDVDVSRAVAAGLRCRAVRETVFDTWAWLSADGRRELDAFAPRTPHGMTADREAAVLAAWDARREGASGWETP